MDSLTLFAYSLLVSLPFLIVFLWISARLVRGRSTSHWQWLSLAAFAVPLIPASIYGTASVLNRSFDNGEPLHYQATIENTTHSQHRRRHDRYYARFPSWRNPSQTYSHKISRSEYDKIQPGQTLIKLTLRRGWLGYEWIEKVTIEEPEKKKTRH